MVCRVVAMCCLWFVVVCDCCLWFVVCYAVLVDVFVCCWSLRSAVCRCLLLVGVVGCCWCLLLVGVCFCCLSFVLVCCLSLMRLSVGRCLLLVWCC